MQRDRSAIAKYISGLGMLEGRAFQLFECISKKIELPRVKFSLLYVAYDSLKNSTILLELSKSLEMPQATTLNYESIMGETWRIVGDLYREIMKLENISREDLARFADRLISVYARLIVQLKTLRYMSKEISQSYGVDLESLEDIFDLLIGAEETDSMVLMALKGPSENPASVTPSGLFVKYTNPDRWYQPPTGSS